MSKTVKSAIAMLSLCGALPAFAGQLPPACPATAESYTSSGTKPEKISGVMLWQARVGAAIDSAAPPSLEPDQSIQAQNSLTATWQLDQHTPGWRYYLDCEYGSAGHFILFDVTGLSTCVERESPYSASGSTPSRATFAGTCK